MTEILSLSSGVLQEEIDYNEYYRVRILRLAAGRQLDSSKGQFETFYVLDGRVRVAMSGSKTTFNVGGGWLSLPSQSQTFEAEEESRLFAVNNTTPLSDVEITGRAEILNGLSDYIVTKPWGFERWYIESGIYVFKGIKMNAGHECSLQLHEQKVEVNLVLSGRVQLTLGEDAGVTATVKLHKRPSDNEVDAVKRGIVPVIINPGSGWKARPYEIHQVRSLETYFALEVSSPQVDDVIRLKDLTNRLGGRIASEHVQRS